MRLGGIEAGGTKIVCAAADEKGNVYERETFPTEDPQGTMKQLLGFFEKHPVEALGIASFGPIDLHPDSPTFGKILRTPKEGWDDVNMVTPFRSLHVPIGLDTDVNGAILGEVVFGAAQNAESAIYITVGTGIGVGVYVNGGLLHGCLHPESGHILVQRHPKDRSTCYCNFHTHCLEGLASGTALRKKWGLPADQLYDRPEVWEMESYYLAQAITNYILSYAPQKIVLWGGVMHYTPLFDLVRAKVKKLLNGYVEVGNMEEYIIAPALGENSGVLGATQLGYRAWQDAKQNANA